MSNQHTVNHNEDLTLSSAVENNHFYEAVVSRRNRTVDDAVITPIPWKQIHRANVPHLTRHGK